MKQYRHPNIREVAGVAAILDTPSRHSHAWHHDPGSAGPDIELAPRLIIPRHVAEACAPSLVGMSLTALVQPIGEHPAYSQIAPLIKVGMVTDAQIKGNTLHIAGIIWCLDFPQLEDDIIRGGLGLCLGIRMPAISKVDEKTLRLDAAIFTACHILLKEQCGFEGTEISINHGTLPALPAGFTVRPGVQRGV